MSEPQAPAKTLQASESLNIIGTTALAKLPFYLAGDTMAALGFAIDAGASDPASITFYTANKLDGGSSCSIQVR